MTTHSGTFTDIYGLSQQRGFALIHRQGADTVDVLKGNVVAVPNLADIPLSNTEVLAMVPFRQVQERGFAAIEDNAAILCLTEITSSSVPAAQLVSELPDDLPKIENLGFDLTDEEYAEVTRNVIRDEIGRGEGANFVIRRDYRARIDGDELSAALTWYRRLLEDETGAYWTFLFVTPDLIAVGASPERHVSSTDGVVLMNPISGTLRHGDSAPTTDELLNFLNDRKESEELVMVVDEELKMMSAACPEGGVMHGPFLKPMSRVTHTEYLLEGRSSLDPREILRLTMFAPTVTGSPMGNACRVIARHEPGGRGYYSGILARFTPRKDGFDVDAPILIRTAFIDGTAPEDAPNVTVSAGATLVRHSDPLSEAAETRAKVSGMLHALGLASTPQAARGSRPYSALEDPRVAETIVDRNRHLAPFWRDEQPPTITVTGDVLVIDCEDDFTAMLAHQLGRLGMTVTVSRWDEVADVTDAALVVFGPGPGDPLNLEDPRIVKLRELILTRLDAKRPLLAVCLSHQVLSSLAGLPIVALPETRQGTALDVELGAGQVRIGYYNTFSAVARNGSITPKFDLTVLSEPDTMFVHSLQGPGVASVQGHLESVLSLDGFDSLARLTKQVLDGYPIV